MLYRTDPMVLIMAYGESLPVASYCLFTYFHTFDYAIHFILFQDNTYIFMVLLIVLYLNWQLIRKYEPIQVMYV